MNLRKLSDYGTLIFDCDGVILNSNSIKTEAFYKCALPFGKNVAEQFRRYHIENGGVSRYLKFEHLQKEILKSEVVDRAALLSQFAELVKMALLTCEVSSCLPALRQQTSSIWYVASGGDQAELREVFVQRDLASMFEGGIFGSPTPKREIVQSIVSDGRSEGPYLMLGDSVYDQQVAAQWGIDFIFVSEWSEVQANQIEKICADCLVVRTLCELVTADLQLHQQILGKSRS